MPSREETVRLERHGPVALVTIDNPPVNALGRAVRQRLWDLTAEIEADSAIRAVVVTGCGRLFVGGADIAEFDLPPAPPHLPDVLARIEGSAKPWIAAVNGAALGGGLELALACHHRLAAPATTFALPEVRLGVIPGAGGTQRLPRLVGIAAALSVIVEQEQLSATRALELGLVEQIIDGSLIQGALAFAVDAAQSELPSPASTRPLADPGDDFWIAAEARTRKSARGAAAPLAAFAAVRTGALSGFAAGLAAERESFLRLRASEEAAALRHLFFAERAAPRPAALRGVTPRHVARVGVVGGGTMGVGIAAAMRNAGLEVCLSERDGESLERGMSKLKAIFEAQVRRGQHSQAEAESRLVGVTAHIGLEGLADCDLVIEAVFEDLAVKRAVFADLGRICRPDAILATNTSYIDPRQIAEGLPDLTRFIGLHFFSPAQIMKLLEVIPLPETVPEVLAAAFRLASLLAKVPVLAGICDGFIGNRILKHYRAEAEAMLREGVAFSDIDAAMRGFGYGMGPFEMQDLAGLDIAFMNREAARARGEDVPENPGDILVRAGRLGQKSGGGWYDYAPGDHKPRHSEATVALIAPISGPAKALSSEQIVQRLVGAMADEGRKILSQGIATDPDAIDLVEVHGYGFPRTKGGPMFLAARKGRVLNL